ncbi:unnamed protein product [Lota lota]
MLSKTATVIPGQGGRREGASICPDTGGESRKGEEDRPCPLAEPAACLARSIRWPGPSSWALKVIPDAGPRWSPVTRVSDIPLRTRLPGERCQARLTRS